VPPRSPSATRSARVPVRRARQQTVTGVAAVGLVLAGAAVLLAGVVGGWSVTRLLGGQSPGTTLNVTSVSSGLSQHIDDELGFTIPVPHGWTAYPHEPADGEPSVSFVSPDGSEELTVQRAESVETGKTVPGTVLEGPFNTSAGAVQLRYADDQHMSWRHVEPAEKGAWTVTLTVPQRAAGETSAALFELIADGFAPTTA
jgi:hypothetical protein